MREAVLDASAMLQFLLDPVGTPAVGRIFSKEGARPAIPHLCDVEVLSALRRLVLAGVVAPGRGAEVLEDLGSLPMERYSHLPLAVRALDLWQNMTIQDALYVALAEGLDVPLLTGDRRLMRAAAEHTRVEVAVV